MIYRRFYHIALLFCLFTFSCIVSTSSSSYYYSPPPELRYDSQHVQQEESTAETTRGGTGVGDNKEEEVEGRGRQHCRFKSTFQILIIYINNNNNNNNNNRRRIGMSGWTDE